MIELFIMKMKRHFEKWIFLPENPSFLYYLFYLSYVTYFRTFQKLKFAFNVYT